MSSDLAIRVEGLSKAYTVRHKRHDHVTLAQSALERAKHPFQRDEREEFWALQDVSFEVKQGEVLGIIGRNGAGKSTLLKLLTRITAPTKGRIDLWGRVGSLLEVGTGFHPELTGRENIYLNGSILGMRKREIDQQFDAIVDFAGVEKFLDTPVKRYSSGMYVRLAFAVAAHLETEILLLDEVLAVGDADFQQKCLEKIRSVAKHGHTVLLVSHDTARLDSVSDSCLLLNGGRVVARDAFSALTTTYRQLFSQPSPRSLRRTHGPFVVEPIDAEARSIGPRGPHELAFIIEPTTGHRSEVFVSVVIVDERNNAVAHCDSRMSGTWLRAASRQRVTLCLRSPWLHPGTYRADLYICSAGVLDHIEGISFIVVSDESPYIQPLIAEATSAAQVLADFDYRVEELDTALSRGPARGVTYESLL